MDSMIDRNVCPRTAISFATDSFRWREIFVRAQVSALFVIFWLWRLQSYCTMKLVKDVAHGEQMISKTTTTPISVGFPLDYVDRSAKYSPQDHINLMENNDFIFNEMNCATWHHGREFHCKIEWDEWMLVNAFVKLGDVVIEFGARFGTTSCILSRNVGTEGHVISVEPDINVHGYLLRNRHDHHCNYHAVLGTVSNTPLFLGSSAYAGQTSSSGKGPSLPRLNVTSIERVVGTRINVALIDCEGCIPYVEQTGLLGENGVDLILMEEDIIDYTEWHLFLRNMNYKCVWYLNDTFDPVNSKWSRDMRHSVWVHERVLSGDDKRFSTLQSCEEYVSSKNLSTSQIDCSQCPH